jgi:stage III sporulation protein SpoIIIAA
MKTQNLFDNTFVKYNETSLTRLLGMRLEIIQDSSSDIELIADAAIEMKEIKVVLDLFTTARENELELTDRMTGIQLIEMVSGKTWEEMKKAPSLGELTSNAAGKGVAKMAGGLNRFGSWLADKTKKGEA